MFQAVSVRNVTIPTITQSFGEKTFAHAGAIFYRNFIKKKVSNTMDKVKTILLSNSLDYIARFQTVFGKFNVQIFKNYYWKNKKLNIIKLMK
jgi:hypothetical protein